MNTYPGIPAVSDDRELAPTVRALAEVVELLTGDRGDGSLQAAPASLAVKVRALEVRLTALETRYNDVFGAE